MWQKISQGRKAVLAAVIVLVSNVLILMDALGVDSVRDFPEKSWWFILLAVLTGGGVTWGVRNGASSNPTTSTPQR